ncbi:MAG: PKD domain-containing protein, partial [Bacteroidetes bacterium]
TIAEPDELTVSATTSQATICDGGSAQLSATASAGAAPLSYNWTAIPADGTLNATDQNPTVSPTANTVYSVTVTDANGCTATDLTTIDISPSITATAAMSQESNCGQADGEATVSAIGGAVVNDYGYSWSTNPAQSTATATGLLPGTYTVTVTDDIGCSSTTDVTITSTAGFTASITSVTDATCNGTCNGTATVQESVGAVQPVLYAWSSIPPQFTASAAGLCAGNYQVLVTDGTGCTATASVTIDEPQPIVVTATASTAALCIGQSADLSAVASGGTPPIVSYSWSATPSDPSLNGSAQNPSVDPTATTTYTVTATDANGCIATDQVTVSVLPALSLSISSPTSGSDTTICPGGTATISLEASGGDGNYSFYLQPDILNPISLPMMVQPSSATTYEFVVTDGCGTPPALASSTISIYGLPTISVSGFESGCHPHTVELAYNTTPAPASWSWNFGDPQSNSNTSSQSAPSHTFSGPGTYDIALTIETAEGCTVDTVFSNAVQVYAPPTADFSHNPTTVTTVDGQVSFTDESSANVDSWYWNFGTGDTALTQNPQYTFNDTGTYVVWLTVSTADGCQAVARGTVRVEPSFTFYVPNSFTPDRDGINDRFRGYGEGVNWDTYEIRVFTRWGEEIFYSNSIDLPWDATFKGSPVEVGVYVWTINVQEVSGRMHYYRGHVNVIR